MKHEYTFNEVAKIFAQVSKIEEKGAKYTEAEETYQRSKAEYIDSGYSLVLGEAMCEASAKSKKALKAFQMAVQAFIKDNGLSSDDYEEDYIIKNAKRSWNTDSTIYGVQSWAKKAATRINI